MIQAPFNLHKWIDENRHLLKPPVGNQVLYKDADTIVMVVGGPNSRKDFHYNEGEEFFYQLQGDMQLPIIEDGKVRVIDIREGEVFLLPAKVPHSPQRGANTIGLVIEQVRKKHEEDACMWYCENCNELLHKATFHLDDIVTQLPVLMNSFYDNEELTCCKKCGTVMQRPTLKQA
jgi:3-hydroxyanthranilate 3,4-dioxygenase